MHNDGTSEFAGYNLFKEIWAEPSRPDGVFIFPDVVCRGSILAVLELGLKIPRDLKVILHRNSGIDYVCPWAVPYLVTNVEEVSRLLADHLDVQFRGRSTTALVIHPELMDLPAVTGR